MLKKYLNIAICLLVLTLGGGLTAWGCTVPVFRYALERWRASPHVVTIFHTGPLQGEDKAVADALLAMSASAKVPVNLEVTIVDVTNPAEPLSPELKTLWEAQKTKVTPWMVVNYPERTYDVKKDTWYAGKLDARVAGLLIDSPLRQQIAKKILAGESAVFIVLESGDKTKDDALIARLESNLQKLAKVITLPEVDPDDARKMSSELPLRIAFSILRVARNDPREALFRIMLLGGDDELATSAEPVVVPIYGRGRAMGAIVGKLLTDDEISGICGFITGPCSCEVKEQNPGYDLVLAADWEALIENRIVVDPEIPALVSIAGLGAVPVVTTAPATTQQAEPASAVGGLGGRTLVIAISVIAVVVLLAGLFLMLRREKGQV